MSALTIALVAASLLCRAPAAFAQAEAPAPSAEKLAAATAGAAKLAQEFNDPNVSVSGAWMAYRQNAPVAPQTTVRFGMTIAFPEWTRWKGF